MSGPALIALDVAGRADPWAELGLVVADGVIQLGDVVLRFDRVAGAELYREDSRVASDRNDEEPGIRGWSLEGAAGPAELDGLATIWLPQPVVPTRYDAHPLGATALDHVVVTTPDPPRTFACFESAGMTLRLARDAGSEERPLRQGFFRHGEARVEVVGPREVVDDGPASFWGLTIVVEDLDAAVSHLGAERCSEARDAVQPGRRIATLRRAAGLPTAVALISPAQ